MKYKYDFTTYKNIFIEEIKCPKCKSLNIESTCLGILPGNVDTNRTLCHDCGWCGIREECKVPHKVED